MMGIHNMAQYIVHTAYQEQTKALSFLFVSSEEPGERSRCSGWLRDG
jgi:hypothetical protein